MISLQCDLEIFFSFLLGDKKVFILAMSRMIPDQSGGIYYKTLFSGK
jgi:hypothetical protein